MFQTNFLSLINNKNISDSDLTMQLNNSEHNTNYKCHVHTKSRKIFASFAMKSMHDISWTVIVSCVRNASI